jgi:coniferyl-aldehyde dehydrogenase
MAAAAANLTPVTLELGGKSPAIVLPDAPLDRVAARLATGKWFNAGQTCIAPDYVLVPAGHEQALADALRGQFAQRYGRGNGDDFSCIVSDAQRRRLQDWLDEAHEHGARIETLGDAGTDPRRMAPALVLDAPDDTRLLQEEIFGPVLPIRGYTSLDEAIAFVRARGRPLALYPFGQDRAAIERILRETLAGGVTVNDTLLHFGIDALPFGGVGASGMGAYHGRAGFDAFSKQLPVLWQRRWAGTDLLRPPYARIGRLLRLLTR